MIEAVYGLKDAPRAWQKKLHAILTSFGLSSIFADPQLYVRHERSVLKMILSAHVDDLKGGARKSDALRLLAHLEKEVGEYKQEWESFTHVGIEHVKVQEGIWTHQDTYVSQLKELPKEHYDSIADDTEVNDEASCAFSSLLGGVAWLCLTNVAIAVYVQALQRHGKAPRGQDLKRLNLALRWAKKHRVGILFRKVKGPLRLVAISDAAFKAVPDEASGLALRGAIVLLCSDSDTSPASPDKSCILLEAVCKRQRRVVRSTFSGELNGLIDTVELVMVIQMCLYQVWYGTEETATQLALKLDHGMLTPPCEAVIDARSVFDCLAATDAGELVEGSLKLHVLSLRERESRISSPTSSLVVRYAGYAC